MAVATKLPASCAGSWLVSRMSEVFLAGLPEILKVHVSMSLQGDGWRIRFASPRARERPDAGTELVLAKLSEVLFIETLRRYISNLPLTRSAGWPGREIR